MHSPPFMSLTVGLRCTYHRQPQTDGLGRTAHLPIESKAFLQ
jgi:hypothetical protein